MELTKTKFRIEDAVGFITLDSPSTLNAFDGEMNPQILYLLEKCENTPEVKIVVIEGLKKAFSAGGNLSVFYSDYKEHGQVNLDELLVQAANITSYIRKMGKLVVTSVSGAAAGAGANLALSGDFVLASENARFIQAFVNVGLVPDTGGALLLCRAVGFHRALELCLSGRPLSAQEAKDLGMVHEICTADELSERTAAFAKKLAAGPIKAYANIKRQIHAAAFFDYDAFLNNVELTTQSASMKTKDFEKALCGFIEKKAFTFTGE